MPFISLLYLLSFLIARMSTDLHLYCLRYNLASSLFFRLSHSTSLVRTIMVAWGIIMTLISLVNSFQGLLIARVALGLAEGGLFPGVAYYITMWYPRQIQGRRLAIFFSAAAVTGAFGGVFAYLIDYMDGKAGLHGWQWIFLIEGLRELGSTVVIALLAFRFLNDLLTQYPETTRLLTGDELCTLVPIYSVALFLPTIIHDLGYSAARVQLLTVPPFVCSCISTIIVGIYSDKLTPPGAGYVAVIIAASGVFSTVPIILSWAGGNAGGEVKRVVVFAMVVGFGNFRGILASFIYYQPPSFHQGHGTIIGCLCTRYHGALNKEKKELCIREGIVDSMQDRYRELGDESPLFR
ncbi:MFS general substrate transporter [Russula emetica]|nr:MFS general substrate transporter [Russula emetica]